MWGISTMDSSADSHTFFLEAGQQPTTAAAISGLQMTRSRRVTALIYAQRIDWPHMSRPVVVATLRALGGLLNQYRRAWVGAPGTNPITEVIFPSI